MPPLSERQQYRALLLAASAYALFCIGIRLGYQFIHGLLLQG
ncbi:hypothetical protein [Janthinobacterium sp.]|nr:hypothetical protein [Janthinobacterium sp.]